MDLTQIFSISGKPGLHQLVASAKNGVIVESLETKKRFIAYSTYKISSLEDITVFTVNDDMPLKEVFNAIGKDADYKEIAIPKKELLKSTLEKYVPSFDQERVYESDIKKMFSWYNLLVKAGLMVPTEEKAEEKLDAKSTDAKKTAKPKAAAKPAAKAKTAPVKKNTAPKTAGAKKMAVKKTEAKGK
jgi:hypothetical protein